MVEAELRYGQNQRLKAIAQEIIVDQTQEITLMRLALGEPLPQPQSYPTQIPARAVSIASAETSGSTQTQMRTGPGMQMAPMGQPAEPRATGHGRPGDASCRHL